ncbi:sprT-like domain-containing protein Spartan [Oryzias latipes]|uniref:sprT-like domain-containing protein Spartan n=1 Tax=Oryzias latipes TaxID=8090 RepID=UPI0002A4C62B|nr:sprT-like domain-containing protein Spartan [Oryzias latipes]
MDEDFLLAVQLQEQFDHEYESSLVSSLSFNEGEFGNNSKKRKVELAGGARDRKPTSGVERPLSIVDDSWEMLDPSPDVRAMFLEFNDMFFWGKLSGVEVKWSPRMTLCAGVCSYEGRGGLCSIRLSEPLLKLRPRKDLVETLLHEMIHALLFVTQNNRDRDGHGPEFCKHMNRINQASGTKITVYHSFHDEVDVYRQHWWRCDGPCQNRRPYFGYVKRAMNRAPSSLDPWWEDHRRTCGGTYTKIKEPDGYGKKGKKDGKKSLGTSKTSNTAKGSGSQDIRNIIPFSGKGILLGGNSQNSPSSSAPPNAATAFTKTPLSIPVSSPQKLLTPTSPVNTLGSPKTQRPFINSSGKNPPVRSVGNTKAFININGSPVKIPKVRISSGDQGADGKKQKSIQELFKNSTLRNSDSQSAKPENKATDRLSTSSSITEKPKNRGVSEGTRSLPDSIRASGAAGGSQTTRKRSRDDQSGSAGIFDFFQKISAASAVPVRTTLPAASNCASPLTCPSQTSERPGSSSASSSILMVSCPVCQAKVQEPKINQHLDSCLS